MEGCVFVGKVDKCVVKSLSDDLFSFGIEMSKAIQRKSDIIDVENRLLVEIFDTDDK